MLRAPGKQDGVNDEAVTCLEGGLFLDIEGKIDGVGAIDRNRNT